ncbi:MAG TPA: sigma 54-interacting transcriptional regulator [Candidatus Eisenbacteria bacterium]|jgi:DNA-binding NtrC family response regulator
MTWVPREERRAQGAPSASLLRINRNALSNILVVGGAPTERAAIAGALHRDSRLRGHPFCVTASGSYEGLLRRSLLSWLGHDAGEAPLACDMGTLFVDDVCALPADVQRLLLALACRLDGVPAEGRKGPGPARLAAGSAEEPAAHVEAGRLLAALHDSLDKLTIHLGTSRSEQATLGDAGGAAAARPGRSAP